MTLIGAFDDCLSAGNVEQFQQQGFFVHSRCIFSDPAVAQLFQQRLEAVLNGEYDSGRPPYKVNKIPAAFKRGGRFSFDAVPQIGGEAGHAQRRAYPTIHAINIWQSDQLFKKLVTDTNLGAAVARFMRWEEYGCRVAQDQVWIKPPHSGPLTYHRDTPYIDFDPKEVCTVWIPFDAVAQLEVGTLEYCVGSHLWGDERRGSANQFYDADYKALLRNAAECEAQRRSLTASSEAPASVLGADELVHVVPVLGEAGCCSFHNGNTWHGSRANTTDGWRRGIGVHYVRGDALFAEETGKLWNDLRGPSSSRELSAEAFPFAAQPRACPA